MNLFNTLELDFSPTLKKILSVMRLTMLCLLVFSLNISASVYSQNTKLSLNVENQSIKDILYLIENQSDFRFIYESGEVDLSKKVTVNVKEQTVEAVLKQLFENVGINYEITENNLILINPSTLSISVSSEIAQKKKIIKGVVKDINGEPIIGANVVEKGTTNGIITDIDGKFSLEVATGAILQISFVGYSTQEVEIRNQSTVSIKLKEDSELLDEVVVVGYGTVKKSDLTGSVASVSDRQFKDQPIKRVEDILQGRTPGVEVTALTGMPGESIKVRIRGTTSINKSSNPLYVIDGIVSSTGLDGLNPLDIQSIEVLKDASATAIYGSRGANGVVLVTTRKGQEGRVSIVFDASVGISNMAKKYDLLNAYEYALALNDMWGSSTIQQADLEAYKNGIKVLIGRVL